MGSDGDILISHGPPVFTHGPATYYNSYGNIGNCRFVTNSSTSSSTSSQRQRLKSPNRANGSRSTSSSERKPRPCLVVRPDDSSSSSSSSSDENEPQSPNGNRQKKKVVFADDRGFSLTQIRLMVETPLDKLVPLKAFANLHLTPATTETSQPSINLWKVMFNQPASNYLEFRKRLEESNVSLENVIVKVNENDLTGTVKVKNICFEKSVIVRSTTNNWSSHQDINCSFVDNNTSSSVTIIYDTFSFKIPLRDDNDNIQFCVCFKSDQGEYWDNNDGKNYTLVRNNEETAVAENKTIKNVRDIINNGISQHVPVRSNTWPSYAHYNTTNINSYQGSVYW